jgi:hypothetical protein
VARAQRSALSRYPPQPTRCKTYERGTESAGTAAETAPRTRRAMLDACMVLVKNYP